jgi:amino acid transporter
MSQTESTHGLGENQLKRNTLRLPTAMAMSLACISPTIGVISISTLIATKAGVSSPIVFLLGTVGIAVIASTLAQFPRRVTSAGTFYKFITLSMGKSTGFVVFVGVLAWYSVHTSMRFDIAFLIPEVSVAAILLILIVFKGGESGQVPAAFTPTHSTGDYGGLSQAFVFIVLAFFGFESCTTVGEETKNFRRNLPMALIGSVVLTGLWFIFAMYSEIVGYGAKHIDKLASASAPLSLLQMRVPSQLEAY